MNILLSKNVLHSRVFWIVVILKLACGIVFAWHYVTKVLLPFVDYFIQKGINPYDYFYQHHQSIFPYPSMMLFILTTPMFIGKLLLPSVIFQNTFSQLFFIHMPIFIADVIIFLILCSWLPSKEKRVIWFYFTSPILFYINYYHGQLDGIPTALLFISLFLLLKKRYFVS